MVQTPTAVFLQYSREIRAEVDAALDRHADFDGDCPESLREAIRHSLLAPAKRLRPLLVLLAAESCGCERQRAMPAAVAIEMVHTYSLIHDDLPAMDDDDLRRGRPSCHALYGEAMAILAGDALLARAFEVLSEEIQPPAVAARCCAQLSRAAGASALVGGQADDLAAESSPGDLAQLERIHRRKTGALFVVALRLGGTVAGAGDLRLQCLDRFGKNLGLAFQIVDDLLDVQGDQAILGKRTGKDRDRGKLTFPAILGVRESRLRAGRLVDEACTALATMEAQTGHLEALARYVLDRDK
jgi:geranylgeranyl diphosphate synthase type II